MFWAVRIKTRLWVKGFLHISVNWGSNPQLVHSASPLPLLQISLPRLVLHHHVQHPTPNPLTHDSKCSNYSIQLFPPPFQTQDFAQSTSWHRKRGLIWATFFSEPAHCSKLNNQCCPSQLFPFQLINLNWPLSQQSFWLIFSLTTLSCRPVQHLRNVW